MSWPHILSFSRVVAGPVVAGLVLLPSRNAYLLAAIVFSLASFTDLIDGKLARHSQRVSPLGIFLDTTADKILVSLVLVSLAVASQVSAWVPLVIIGREMIISGLRSFGASRGQIISAHVWGKGKAALTMVAIPCVLCAVDGKSGGILGRIGSRDLWNTAYTGSSWLLALAGILTVISGARYLIDARSLFQDKPLSPVSVREERRPVAAGRDG